MNMIPEDFRQLLAKQERDTRPAIILWVFDAETGKTTIDWDERHHPAWFPFHSDMVDEKTFYHPDTVLGYAQPIKGGWRIITDDIKPVDDPFVVRSVQQALRHSFPPDLPKVLPHGDPLKHQRS